MLSEEMSDRLKQVGPGTPLGEMMRRYWQPIATSDQVVADGAPLRAKLLGERFVVFRDTHGKVGVLDEHCMHRGASLALGRNEEGGLRCLYHGWKFAVDGTVVDVPKHLDCRRRNAATRAYPVEERAGLIWTYIGLDEHRPPCRSFAFERVPPSHRVVVRANVPANWLTLWEGGMDSSHVAVLHTNLLRPTWVFNRRGEFAHDPAPWELFAEPSEVEETESGLTYRTFRDCSDGARQEVRRVPAILPNMRIIPLREARAQIFEVPMDDDETATFIVEYNPKQPVDRGEIMQALGFVAPYYDEKTCEVMVERLAGLGQDRVAMAESWSGYSGIAIEDIAIAVSQRGWDRAQEHLIGDDDVVVRLRRMVIEAIDKVASGQPAPGAAIADMTDVSVKDDFMTALLQELRTRRPQGRSRYWDQDPDLAVSAATKA